MNLKELHEYFARLPQEIMAQPEERSANGGWEDNSGAQ